MSGLLQRTWDTVARGELYRGQTTANAYHQLEEDTKRSHYQGDIHIKTIFSTTVFPI